MRCEYCGESPRSDPHHVYAGAMGGSRIDLGINVVALCRHCHMVHHGGHHPTKAECLGIIAARQKEWRTVDEIERELYRVRRLAKNSNYMAFEGR